LWLQATCRNKRSLQVGRLIPQSQTFFALPFFEIAGVLVRLDHNAGTEALGAEQKSPISRNLASPFP